MFDQRPRRVWPVHANGRRRGSLCRRTMRIGRLATAVTEAHADNRNAEPSRIVAHRCGLVWVRCREEASSSPVCKRSPRQVMSVNAPCRRTAGAAARGGRVWRPTPPGSRRYRRFLRSYTVGTGPVCHIIDGGILWLQRLRPRPLSAPGSRRPPRLPRPIVTCRIYLPARRDPDSSPCRPGKNWAWCHGRTSAAQPPTATCCPPPTNDRGTHRQPRARVTWLSDRPCWAARPSAADIAQFADAPVHCA